MKSSRITRSIHSNGLLLALLLVNMELHPMAYAKHTPKCRQWLEKITQATIPGQTQGAAPKTPKGLSGPLSDPWSVASLTDADRLAAIGCLLGAENDLKPAALSGATRLDISQTFAPARVNLAALYAISYIYSGHYDHAGAVALRGDDASYIDSKGNYGTKPSAIHKAYQAYRAWFVKVRQLGLAKAKRSGLQPLEGTGLRWY